MATTVTRENRTRYAELCKEAKAERIFLAVGDLNQDLPENLKENVEYFQSCGFEVGIWTDTIGHGMVLSHVVEADLPSPFRQMVDIHGKQLHHACCPLDPQYKEFAAKRVAALAETGASIIMLDDDFRLSNHGGDLSCGCDLHLERIGEILGEQVSLEQLRPYLLSGKKNKYRSAWLKAQDESLQEFASALREEMDKKHPDTAICICMAPCLWEIDGADVEKLTCTLAGKNKREIRLSGGPYWAAKRKGTPIHSVMENARLYNSFADDWGFERMAEGDVYPRPRYTCPASFLELYDLALQIDGGYEGILKYMIDYVAGPDFELGYLKHHQMNRSLREKLPAFFKKGANSGVRIHAKPHTFEKADLDLCDYYDKRTPRAMIGTLLGGSGIPTLYRGDGFCHAVSGETAREIDRSILKEGMILDATAAVILMERGVDVGLAKYQPLQKKNIAFIHPEDRERKSLIEDGEARVLPPNLKEGAKTLLWYSEPSGSTPLAYCYENKEGERFLVFLFECESINRDVALGFSGLLRAPSMQEILEKALPWVAKEPIPAYCVGNPHIYLMAEQDEDSMSVALFNCFADQAIDPVVVLGEEYKEIECLNCEASLQGNRVTIESPFHAFTFAAFKVKK